MFKHYVITRFNLRHPDWKTNKNQVKVLTDSWHTNRFKLFKEFCVPGINSQTNTDFEWLVFFDSSTKATYKQIIEDIKNETPNMRPIFIDGMEAFLPQIKSRIQDCDAEYIITSRIDNDDCIAASYIEEIQAVFNKQKFMALDFTHGYTLQIEPEFKLGKKIQNFNPFMSLIEINENPSTIWDIPHTQWKRETKIIQIPNKRIWTSIIHEENKINAFTGFGKVDSDVFFENFNLSSNLVKQITSAIENQSIWSLNNFKNFILSNWYFSIKRVKKKIGFYN